MATTRGSAGRYASSEDWRVTLAERAYRAIRRYWCWREFSVPIGFVLFADATGHHELARVTGAFALGAVVLLLRSNPGALVRAVRRCRARSQALSRQLAWPGVCREMGWGRRLDDGATLVPDLVSWENTDEDLTVRVRPLPEQDASSWGRMADAMRRSVGGATVRWRESQGTLAMVVAKTGLPNQLSWRPGLSDVSRIVIGQRDGGPPLALDVRRTPHLLLAGATGSGKGGAIRSALAGALGGGWQAIVIDPKESGEYRWLDSAGVPVCSNLAEHVAALHAVDEVRRRRQSAIREHGCDAWTQLPVELRKGWCPVLVVIDEAADLLVQTKGRGERQRQHAALQQEVAHLIAQLARKGRSAGVHVLVAVQRPDTAQLGEQGGALRNNLAARLALGALDSEGIRMLGVPSGDPVAMTLDGTPGRGICVGFGDDPRPSACQVAWLDQEQALSLVTATAAQGLDRIEPSPAESDEMSHDRAAV